ncbi:MAG: ABC transporter permease [Myxococcota bacterium]
MIPDSWLELWEVIVRNKLRTLLTASGVFWGMFMLVLMLGFGNGLEVGVAGAMGPRRATNAVYLWGQRTTMPYRGLQPGRSISYDESDVGALRNEVRGLKVLAPRNQLGGHRGSVNVTYGSETTNISVAGDSPEYILVQPIVLVAGRWINETDMVDQRKNAVIGHAAYEQLFPRGADPLGHHVTVNGVAFQIVGMFESPQSGDRGDREEMALHVPFTTFGNAFNMGDRVGWFAATGTDDVRAGDLEDEIRRVLAERHRIHPDDRQAIGAYNSQEEFERLQNLFAGIRGLVWVVGTATLLSGVVGVSNILLITVRERTSEIGVRRALGATQLQVVWMIVQEALLLTSVAGYSGLVLGVGLLEVASSVIGEGTETMGPPTIDVSVAIAAVLVLMVGGVFAGIIPARRAAAIHPVDALRS